MNLLSNIYPISKEGLYLNVLIEIPKGSIHKYEYDPSGILTVVRDLHKKYKYPFNYGCIPSTLADDDDPLDAIVISNEKFYPCTVVKCHVVGIVKMIDNGKRDDKIICVPYFSNIKKIKLNKLLKYLNNYKYPNQDGTTLLGVYNAKCAWEEIKKCIIE